MNALKLNRLLRGLSQDQVATASGVSQSTYSRIERHQRWASVEERTRIAMALGASISSVFPEEWRPEQESGV